MPFIVLSTTSSTSFTSYVIRTLSPISETTLLSTRYNSTWATTAGPLLPEVSPATILGIPGYPLQHPQPHSTLVTSGTILPFHIASTFPQELAPLTTEPLPPTLPTIPKSIIGTSPYRTRSSHPSLYQPSRGLLLDPLAPGNLPGKI